MSGIEDLSVGDIVSFHDELFFEGAVQLNWTQSRVEQARLAAKSFVFHGPKYHGANVDDADVYQSGYRLKDTASLVRNLLASLQPPIDGQYVNPLWLAVAGYGSGKSHLALTISELLSDPGSELAIGILDQLARADGAIGCEAGKLLESLEKPILVLPLDGMSGFHLGTTLSQRVFQQLSRHDINADPIRDLSPRFQTALRFVERNFEVRRESFTRLLSGLSQEIVAQKLNQNDEAVYAAVDEVYSEANGIPIPVEGQESAQELLDTLSNVYCGPDGPFSGVVILFDEFGRYLEYAAEKPNLAGDSALQQIFQGIQDNSEKIRFIGFIQYELKAYLRRFGSSDLRQLQRYITRFDAAEKFYLSTNLETIVAHVIGKDDSALNQVMVAGGAIKLASDCHDLIKTVLPGFDRFPLWGDKEQFLQVVFQGCWPLHPLSVWFLTRQKDVVQSRSALTFIRDVIQKCSAEKVLSNGGFRQIGAAELVLNYLMSDLIAAERDIGGTIAETLHEILQKFDAHLSHSQKYLLVGVSVLEKLRVGKLDKRVADLMLSEVTLLGTAERDVEIAELAELGALEWNEDIGRYELLSDGASRAQFQQWLRKKKKALSRELVCDLFMINARSWLGLEDVPTDFAASKGISTTEWYFEAYNAVEKSLVQSIQRAFSDWRTASTHKEPKGKVIYLYLTSEAQLDSIGEVVSQEFERCLIKSGVSSAPIWLILIHDHDDCLAENMLDLHVLSEMPSESEVDRFKRFLSPEAERCRAGLKQSSIDSRKARMYWIAGLDSTPKGRQSVVGRKVFEAVYSAVVTFPFDGFASAGGGGPGDAAQLARSLVAKQVDGPWIQAQPKRLQNRVVTLLSKSWGALRSNGKLSEPSDGNVLALYRSIVSAHKSDEGRTLLHTFEQLIRPPYGMNSSSAGLFIGLVLSQESPPRRIVFDGEMISSGDWISKALPGKVGKHSFEMSVLAKSTIVFLDEDSEARWRSVLERWDSEVRYAEKISMWESAEKLKCIEPLPESMEGKYKYLLDATKDVRAALSNVEQRISKWERGLEAAAKKESAYEGIKLGSKLQRELASMESESVWPESLLEDSSTLLAISKQIVGNHVGNWIPKQTCRSVVNVTDFRESMDRAAVDLKNLGFAKEAEALSKQVKSSIHRVEQLQNYELTLAKCDDFPRQPAPSASSTVRWLRDEINLGESLKEKIAKVSALTESEIGARMVGIENRLSILRQELSSAENSMTTIYSMPEGEQGLSDLHRAASSLKDRFSGTRDETDIDEVITTIDFLMREIRSWSRDVGSERLEELLADQISIQTPQIFQRLAENEIEVEWDVEGVLKGIASDRVKEVREKSASWIALRLLKDGELERLSMSECKSRSAELAKMPNYLSTVDRETVLSILDELSRRLDELLEKERRSKARAWIELHLPIREIEGLSSSQARAIRSQIENPPVELIGEEEELVVIEIKRIDARLDEISVDDMVSRIKRLSKTMQEVIFAELKKILK